MERFWGRGQRLGNQKSKAVGNGVDIVQRTHQPKYILSWEMEQQHPCTGGVAGKPSCCFTSKSRPWSWRNGGFEGKISSLAKTAAVLPWKGGASFVPVAAGS